MILTDETLRQLTKRTKWTAQARELNEMGVPYRRRSDGSLVVLEEDLHATTKNKPASSKLRLPSFG